MFEIIKHSPVLWIFTEKKNVFWGSDRWVPGGLPSLWPAGWWQDPSLADWRRYEGSWSGEYCGGKARETKNVKFCSASESHWEWGEETGCWTQSWRSSYLRAISANHAGQYHAKCVHWLKINRWLSRQSAPGDPLTPVMTSSRDSDTSTRMATVLSGDDDDGDELK